MKLFGLEIKIPRILSRERRKAERVRIHETLYLDYLSPEHGKKESGEGRDISLCGVRFACSSPIPKGTVLDLTLRLSPDYASNKILPLKARVVRTYRYPRQKRFRVACAFEEMDNSAYRQLEDFITWLKERMSQSFYFYP